MRFGRVVVSVAALLGLAACGSSSPSISRGGTENALGLQAHPQAVQPQPGSSAQYETAGAPVGDPNAHAPSLAQVRRELKIEQRVAQTLNAMSPGQGFVFPIQPVSAASPPSTRSPHMGVDISTARGA